MSLIDKVKKEYKTLSADMKSCLDNIIAGFVGINQFPYQGELYCLKRNKYCPLQENRGQNQAPYCKGKEYYFEMLKNRNI